MPASGMSWGCCGGWEEPRSTGELPSGLNTAAELLRHDASAHRGSGRDTRGARHFRAPVFSALPATHVFVSGFLIFSADTVIQRRS